jgi:hypothetical protein
VRKTDWQAMRLVHVGNVAEALRMPGGGKLSIVAADSGDEQRKPKGLA